MHDTVKEKITMHQHWLLLLLSVLVGLLVIFLRTSDVYYK